MPTYDYRFCPALTVTNGRQRTKTHQKPDLCLYAVNSSRADESGLSRSTVGGRLTVTGFCLAFDRSIK